MRSKELKLTVKIYIVLNFRFLLLFSVYSVNQGVSKVFTCCRLHLEVDHFLNKVPSHGVLKISNNGNLPHLI